MLSSKAQVVPMPLTIEKMTLDCQYSKDGPWILTQVCALVIFVVEETKFLDQAITLENPGENWQEPTSNTLLISSRKANSNS